VRVAVDDLAARIVSDALDVVLIGSAALRQADERVPSRMQGTGPNVGRFGVLDELLVIA